MAITIEHNYWQKSLLSRMLLAYDVGKHQKYVTNAKDSPRYTPIYPREVDDYIFCLAFCRLRCGSHRLNAN